nr:hypothetical protein [Candidatus Sigynarchaeota archaeon]
ASEDVKNYDDLARDAFQSVEKAKEVLYEQINFMEIGIQKIASDTSILNIPAGKDLILRVLQRGIKDTKEELLKNVDDAFSRTG